jgi:hypothetical protein
MCTPYGLDLTVADKTVFSVSGPARPRQPALAGVPHMRDAWLAYRPPSRTRPPSAFSVGGPVTC